MSVAKKAAKKKAEKHKLTSEERLDALEAQLDGLVHFLKSHGVSYDGSPAPEEEEAEPHHAVPPTKG